MADAFAGSSPPRHRGPLDISDHQKIASAAGPYASEGNSPIPPIKLQQGIIPTPNRKQRRVQFGIDCADMVHFTHWEPGGEHVKQLVVKNVVMKTQKIKYKLPQTRYFSMEFPETQTLSAGMSWTVPITFRPVAKECYSDVIEFTTSFGKFYLPIKATLPEHVLEFPESLDFSLCPLKEVARKTFTLRNTGELASTYEWEIAKPFSINPRVGTLQPGQSCAVIVEFKPQNASVFTAAAVCRFGDKSQWEQSKVTQALTIYGIGKYSHLAIEGKVTQFDFGEVYVGKSVEKRFILENHSAVPANFQIKNAESDTEPYFAFSVQSGTIQSHRKMEISIVYTPVAAGMVSTEYFNITTQSGNTLQIICSGSGIGPRVVLNTSIINFNDVPSNTTVIRPLYLQNHSPIAAFYQFLTEPNSTFEIDKPWGTINPNSSVALTIKFCPVEPINYYRRVYCLVEHQDGLFLDIIGTCYNEKRRPSTFHPTMIENYRRRVENGLWSFGPEHLEEMLKSGVVKSENGILSYADPKYRPKSAKQLDAPESDGAIASEYFYENTGTNLAVTLLDTYVDFGSCSRYRIIDNQVIRIANNTNGKMSCVWRVPGETDSAEAIFSVSPKSVDIQPKGVNEFRITFRPKADNAFYGAQLECFVYFKSMRNFRLVNEDIFTPPWCLTPTVAGNTFPPGEDTFIPKINFGANRLDFPSCHVDKSVYRTVRVSNTGDTPVKFAFIEGNSNTAHGIGGGTLLASEGGHPFSDLHVRGYGFVPHLSFENDNILCFRPTCIGSQSSRVFIARNTSRISVDFEWKIPKHYSSFVSVEPTTGTLPRTANSPSHQRRYTPTRIFFFPPITHADLDTDDDDDMMGRKHRATLTVIGNTSDSRLKADPQTVDFGAILVNTLSEKEITLYNAADCDVFYNLVVKFSEDLVDHPKPHKNNDIEGTRFLLCEVIALGVNPVVQVMDVRCDNMDKPLLWDLFSLDQFNAVLSAVEPTISRIELTEPEDLTNPGVVNVAWIFYFPNDLEVEIENWADPGDYTEEQIHTNLILDNALFTISPKSGVLRPGEFVHIVMSYRHEFAGLHTLPVLFKLKNGNSRTEARSGKEVLIYFIGYTVPIGEKCLYFHSSHHRFHPVSIGSPQPPIQTYKLYNRGSVGLDYQIDVNPLKNLKKKEHAFEIMTCLNPCGSVPAGGDVSIDWIFRPLEAKEYKVDVPIIVTDGKTHIVTFSGEGFHHEETENDPRRLPDTIPRVQKLSMPKQIASLTLERANFGFVPLGSQSRQITVLRNTSPDMVLSFRWIIPAAFENVITVSPQSGRLGGGQSRMCKFTFVPQGSIRIYDLNIACEIVNETEMEQYQTEREEMNAARREGRLLSMEVLHQAHKREKSTNPKKSHPLSGSTMKSSDRYSIPGKKYRRLPNIYPPKTTAIAEVNEGEEGRHSSLSSTLHFCIVIDGVSGLSSFFHPRKIFYAEPDELQPGPERAECFEITSKMCLHLLDDVFQDLSAESVHLMPTIPYFAQVTSTPKNGILLDDHEKSEPLGVASDLVLSSYEFQNLAEHILEATLFNIMQEVEQDEFDFTRYCMTVVTDDK
ncbi:hypothetical protein BC829DRAFT_448428 [Chytridium lagenaria]|nr:hypothetical protein BC829DRAFT_448428 [Chytridium lagenaria]